MIKGMSLQQPELIGREEELDELKQLLDNAIEGKGSTIFISGEAGIGKTRLIEEFQNFAKTKEIKILSGAAAADTVHPFLAFSKALEGEISKPLFHEQEYTSFADIFAVDRGGLLVAKATPEEEELDADIFAGMLSAVQSFVRDSFDSSGEQTAGLGRLEYGDMKILIEHGEHLFLTAVFRGAEHPNMKNMLKSTVREIEEKHGNVLESWSGKMEEVAPIQEEISSLADTRFLVRRDLEGVKLENERIKIADNVLELLVEMARSTPLVIVLEDLHWADESSLFVLNYLARNVRKENILVVGTLRPEESEILQKTMGKMRDEEILAELVIEKLEKDYVASLVNELYAPNDFPPTFAERLANQCEGNPFFVIEMLRQIQEDGNIAKEDEKYMLVSEDYTIPSTVEDVVYRRLEMLEPDTLALAEYASCTGREFECDAAFSLQSLKEPARALEKLKTTGIVIRNNGTAEFSHAIFQDVIYSSIGERWKSVYHKSLGEYYEDAYKNRTDEVLYDLARHFSRSKEHKKAFDYCFRAGGKAESAFAAEQSIEFYNLALAVLPRLRQDNEIKDREIEILENLGDVYTLSGEYENAIDNYLSAIEREKEARKKADIHRKIAVVHEKKGDFDKSQKECGKGLELLKDEECIETARLLHTQAWVYMRTGNYGKASDLLAKSLEIAEILDDKKETAQAEHSIGTLSYFKGDYGEALKHLEKALRIRKELDDVKGRSASLNNIGLVHLDRGELDKALEYYEQSLEIHKNIRDKYAIASLLMNIGVVYHYKGELDKTLEYYGQSLEIRENIGDKEGIAMSLINIGIVYHARGELDKTLEYYEQSLEIRENIGDKRGLAMSLINIGKVYHARGDLDKTLEYYEQSLEIHKNIGDKKGIATSLNSIGVVYHDLGELDKALEYQNQSLEICLEIGNKRQSILDYCELAEVNIELEDIQTAFENAEKALEISVEIGAKSEVAISHRVLGTVHREKKDWEFAIKEFEKARAIFEVVGDKNELARLFYEYALLFKAKGEPAKASEHLEKALELFEEMGMKMWVEKTKKVLEET